MSNETQKTNAAPCGAHAVVLMAKLESIQSNADGSVTLIGGTRGDNDNLFPVEVRANETAAEQVNALVQQAKTKGMPGINIWAYGPSEVEFATSKEGDQRPLKLCICADMVRPAHPNQKVEPLQNSGLYFATPSIREGNNNDGTKYYQGSLEFPHLSTEREERNASPAVVKLTGGAAEKLFEMNGKDLMVSGRFTRQTGDMGGKGFDHISFAVSTACELRFPAGTPRMAPKATASNTVVTADYETGFGSEAGDQEAAKAAFASMDF